ncbi:MAG: T9SS type A sorting domain-containing protein [Bacteroidota bacterium]|nr:T9SS type A sorting domain-containing protein [Bacteroidota bacterium]MDP3147200.1 T9SS type A sorting domain-containing protein [Bacteroidota bacterium]
MRKLLIILFLLKGLYSSGQNLNNWDTAWVNSFGGPSIDIGKDIKETSDKGFIIAGTSSSFGNGNTSFYIIKTDSMGLHQWSKAIGSNYNDIAYSVDIASDGGYFFSGISNWNIQSGYDGYLIKTDNLGNVLWSKNYGGNDWDFIYNSCLMPDGGLLLCGETYSDSKGGADAYLIRTNANGDTLWTKKIGTTGNDAFYSVEQKNNRIYVVGKTHNTLTNKSNASIYQLDYNGNILKQDFFSQNTADDHEYKDLYLTGSGDVLLCGKRSSNSTPYYILRKIDTTNFNQFNSFTSPQNIFYNCIIEGNNNDIYTLAQNVGGAGGTAVLFHRFNSTFTYLNAANFGGIKDEDGFEIIRTSRGYAFVGWTKSYGNQNNSTDENVYLVVFNKKDLVNDYFLIVTEFQDNLPMVGLNENKINLTKTIVYPNPINTISAIRFDEDNLDGKTISYQLYDSQGKLVSEENIVITNKHIMINRNELNTGIYTYKLKLNSLPISTGKLSVE